MKMQKKFKKIPHFETEDEEREFWDTHDTTEYIDWSKAEFVSFPNLKPSEEQISHKRNYDKSEHYEFIVQDAPPGDNMKKPRKK